MKVTIELDVDYDQEHELEAVKEAAQHMADALSAVSCGAIAGTRVFATNRHPIEDPNLLVVGLRALGVNAFIDGGDVMVYPAGTMPRANGSVLSVCTFGDGHEGGPGPAQYPTPVEALGAIYGLACGIG